MSATCVWVLIFTLSHTTLGGKGNARLLRLKEGKSATINCSIPASPQQESLSLQTGLGQFAEVFRFDFETNKQTYQKNINSRLQHKLEGAQNVITINNLTVEDTGVYWCVYNQLNLETIKLEKTEESGSVLLVVDVAEQCDEGDAHGSLSGVSVTLILVTSIFSGGVLLLMVIGLLILFIPKMKAWRTNMRVAPTGHQQVQVYEDMRTTIRR